MSHRCGDLSGNVRSAGAAGQFAAAAAARVRSGVPARANCRSCGLSGAAAATGTGASPAPMAGLTFKDPPVQARGGPGCGCRNRDRRPASPPWRVLTFKDPPVHARSGPVWLRLTCGGGNDEGPGTGPRLEATKARPALNPLREGITPVPYKARWGAG
jgi:hypothetical protein